MSYYVNPHGHSCPWYPYAELFGAPNIKWCEETLCQWISEPANTWSNLAYLIFSFYVYWSARKFEQKELLWFAPAMFLMGLFSLIYHMSNNYFTQVLDFLGMFIFVFWMIILNFLRLQWIESKDKVKIYGALSLLGTIILHLMYINFIKIQFIIVAAALTIMLTEYLCFKRRKKDINYTFFGLGLLFIVIAQAFSLMDGLRVEWICNPTNHWFQGHATWHVISAIGLVFSYKHYEQFTFSTDHHDGKLELIIDDIETQLEV